MHVLHFSMVARGEFVLKRGGNVLKGEWKFRYKKEYTKRERGF